MQASAVPPRRNPRLHPFLCCVCPKSSARLWRVVAWCWGQGIKAARTDVALPLPGLWTASVAVFSQDLSAPDLYMQQNCYKNPNLIFVELDKLIFKTAWTNKGPRIVMTLLKGENQVGGLACWISRLIMKPQQLRGYGVGTRIHKQISRKYTSPRNRHLIMIYRYLIYEKDGTLQCWGKTALFNNDARTTGQLFNQKI